MDLEAIYCMCSFKLIVRPIDRLGPHWAKLEPKTKTFNKLAQIHLPKAEGMTIWVNELEKTLAKLNKHCVTLKGYK